MKKFLVVLVVLALTVISTAAMAEVTVSGSIDIRNLYLNNVLDYNDKAMAVSGTTNGTDRNVTTQERVRFAIDAKHEGVKGRIQIENDWDVWGRVEQPQANGATSTPGNAATGAGQLAIREAWIDFNIPGAGTAHVKVGHQFLQLGNGWFFRSGKYGSDAWLVGMPGKNTVAFVNVKASEGGLPNSTTNGWGSADDIDAYVLLDNFKLDDTKTVGAYWAHLKDRRGTMTTGWVDSKFDLDTIGLWFNGKMGALNLQAEFDYQMGTSKRPGGTDVDFKGTQLILQANMAMDALTVRGTLGYGSGDKDGIANNKIDQVQTLLDADPHYTLVYEYFTSTAAKAKNTGFANTTAVGIGADYAINKSVTIGADFWFLKANEKVAIAPAASVPNKTAGPGPADTELGNEIDLKVLIKITDQLTWNWAFGRLMTGKAYEDVNGKADAVDAIQGILSYKF